MSKLTSFARTMPFAHLLGKSAAAKAEDDDKKRDDESEEDYAKRMEDKEEKEKAAKKAEDDKKKEDAKGAGADDDDDDSDMKAEDDEDDGEDKKREGRAKGARERERVRCAAIVMAGINAGSVKQACVFSFDTNLSTKQAIAALGAGQLDKPQGRAGLASRMSAIQTPIAVSEVNAPDASSPKAIADRAIAAAARARGEKI
jgi:hypothetical protein